MKSDATVTATRNQNGSIPEFSDAMLSEFCDVFKLLSDPTRLRILTYLAQEGELNVTELCERLKQSQPAVSHHLALMRVAGIIAPRRDGKHNFYSVRVDHFHELLQHLFTGGGKAPRVRFHDYVLSYEGD